MSAPLANVPQPDWLNAGDALIAYPDPLRAAAMEREIEAALRELAQMGDDA